MVVSQVSTGADRCPFRCGVLSGGLRGVFPPGWCSITALGARASSLLVEASAKATEEADLELDGELSKVKEDKARRLRRYLEEFRALIHSDTMPHEDCFNVLAEMLGSPVCVMKEAYSDATMRPIEVACYPGLGDQEIFLHGKRVSDITWVLQHASHFQLVLPLADVELGRVEGHTAFMLWSSHDPGRTGKLLEL